jgi:condensin complex subunit 2
VIGGSQLSAILLFVTSTLFYQSKRYASTREEEIEADRSIHLEAIERSRASQGDLGRSAILGLSDDDDFSEYGADDFGGGDDNDEPMDNDGMMGAFLTEEEHRFSSISFRESFEASQPPSQTTVLLDAIASGEITGSQMSQFDYFDKTALEEIQGKNQWAGAAHWKKMKRPRKTRFLTPNENEDDSQNNHALATPARSSTRKKRSTKKGSSVAKGKRALVDIANAPFDLEDLLRQPPKPRAKRGAAKESSDPLKLPKAAIAKHSKSDNLLPLDVGIEIRQLSSLFLRPTSLPAVDVASATTGTSTRKPGRTVGFGAVDTWGEQDGGFGGDDGDDGGFCFGFDDAGSEGGENFAVQELDGIRKVQKVQVGYATIAKKVDVKRLKKDLWMEIEDTLVKRASEDGEAKPADDTDQVVKSMSNRSTPDFLSFQEAIRDMQATQSQTDVTLPFYFICLLHLCNEKNLELESEGLEDCFIRHPSAAGDSGIVSALIHSDTNRFGE